MEVDYVELKQGVLCFHKLRNDFANSLVKVLRP